jgi:hypothetical protein
MEVEFGRGNLEVGSRNAEIGKDKIRQFSITVRLKTADALLPGCFGARR